MIICGAAIHRDGHGKCGHLTPVFHHCQTPFIASPFGLFRPERSTPTHILISASHPWPCVAQNKRTGISVLAKVDVAAGTHGL
jgi:hypothetical protein